MKHTEYIIPIGEEAKEFDEIFIGVLRKHKELIRCKDCINRYSTCPMITIHSSGAIQTITYRAQDDWWCCFGKRKEE